jgi:hypothetical protein
MIGTPISSFALPYTGNIPTAQQKKWEEHPNSLADHGGKHPKNIPTLSRQRWEEHDEDGKSIPTAQQTKVGARRGWKSRGVLGNTTHSSRKHRAAWP